MPSSIQGSWLDNKGLMDTHLQYVIRLANKGSMAKGWQISTLQYVINISQNTDQMIKASRQN